MNSSLKLVLLTASLVLAITFTISCSSDDGKEGDDGGSSSSDIASGGDSSSSNNSSSGGNSSSSHFEDVNSSSSNESDNSSSSQLEEASSEFKIEGLTYNNYPKMDGSTSTEPLLRLIAIKLLGFDYTWSQSVSGSWNILPSGENYTKLGYSPGDFYNKVAKINQTHEAIINLIDGEADLSLVARKMSPDEKNHATAAGVSLIETPIAIDAFIFLVNPENPVQTLTIEQIQDIYTGKITNWKEVGGNDAPINPYTRNANSGSQELMESLVMKDLEFAEFPEGSEIGTMGAVLEKVSTDIDAICYTVYYYKEYIQRPIGIKTLEIDGIYPDRETIGEKTYSLWADVYASIRSDLNKSSTAYQLYELLQTKAGKEVIRESEYVPYP